MPNPPGCPSKPGWAEASIVRREDRWARDPPGSERAGAVALGFLFIENISDQLLRIIQLGSKLAGEKLDVIIDS